MANNVQVVTSMTTTIDNARSTLSNTQTTYTTSSNFQSGNATLNSSTWVNIPFSTLSDVINLYFVNDNSVNTASVISLATGSNGQGIFATLIPDSVACIGWSGSFNNGTGSYGKVVGGYPSGTATPSAGNIQYLVQQS